MGFETIFVMAMREHFFVLIRRFLSKDFALLHDTINNFVTGFLNKLIFEKSGFVYITFFIKQTTLFQNTLCAQYTHMLCTVKPQFV